MYSRLMNWWDPVIAVAAFVALALSGVTVWYTRMQAHEARAARQLAEQRPEVWIIENWKGGGFVLINRTGRDAFDVEVELPSGAETLGRQTSFKEISRGSGEVMFARFDGSPIPQPNIFVRWKFANSDEVHTWWRPLT